MTLQLSSASTPAVRSVTHPYRPRRRPPRLAFLLCLALLLGGAAVALPAAVQPAKAAVFTNGLWWGGWGAGNYLTASGELVYCVEPGAHAPVGGQQQQSLVDELPAYSLHSIDTGSGWNGVVSSDVVSGDALRRMNYVIERHGQTTDNETAAAVQMAVWMLRDDPGIEAWLNYHLDWAEAHGGSAVVREAERIAAEARLEARAPEASPGSLQLIATGADRGTLNYPIGTTSLSLTGATFAGGVSVLATDPYAAGTVEWSAEPHAGGWRRFHEVQAVSTWQLPGTGWPAQLRLFPPIVEGQQRLGGSVAGPITVPLTGVLEAALTLDAQFSPVLSTEVAQRFLAVGTPFADRVRFAVADGSQEWAAAAQSIDAGGAGDPGVAVFAPIVAEGTVYGPFSAPQQVGAVAPAGAPIAGRATVVAERGPGEYAVASAESPLEAGYYYWVWEIREQAQPQSIRDAQLLPTDYRFSDAFGLVNEGHLSPTVLRWSTELFERELHPSSLVLRDRVTVSLHGGVWLRDEAGERVPARLRLTVYQSDAQPVRQSSPPSSARVVATGFVEVNAPATTFEADAIELPGMTRGWVTVRACLVREDQPEVWQGQIEEWCDDYGIPSETARVMEPLTLPRTGASEGSTLGAVPVAGGVAVALGAICLLAAGLTRQRREKVSGNRRLGNTQ